MTGVQVVAVHVNGFIFREETSTLPASNSASTTQSRTTPTSASNIPPNTQTGEGQFGGQIGLSTLSAISKSEGLSSSAKVGVGVGVSLAVVVVMCLMAVIILLRRTCGHMHLEYVSEIDAAVDRSEPATGHLFFAKQRWGLNREREIYEVYGQSRKQSHDGPVEMWVSPTHGG